MTTQTQIPLDAMSTDDLQRLVEVAQLVTAARDAMSDEIVTRMAGAMSEGITLLDRLTRNEGLMHLLKVLDRQETQNLLIAMSDAFHSASKEISAAAPAIGGLGCMMRVVRDPGVLEGIRLMSIIGKHMSNSLREQHSRGG
ncbi:MAG: helical membrane plugin domain-containing protein [Thiobacillus sp.]